MRNRRTGRRGHDPNSKVERIKIWLQEFVLQQGREGKKPGRQQCRVQGGREAGREGKAPRYRHSRGKTEDIKRAAQACPHTTTHAVVRHKFSRVEIEKP